MLSSSSTECYVTVTVLVPVYLSANLQTEWPTLTLQSGGIFSISTFALSLLLVFRTNSSYEVSQSVSQ